MEITDNVTVYLRKNKEWLYIRNIAISSVETFYYEWVLVKSKATELDNLYALQLKAYFAQRNVDTIIER